MKITNINRTNGLECKCGSWLEHWIKFGGQSLPRYCSVMECYLRPEVGAHVQRESGANDGEWYVIPVCQAHNAKKGESFKISDWIKLVPADAGKTCG